MASEQDDVAQGNQHIGQDFHDTAPLLPDALDPVAEVHCYIAYLRVSHQFILLLT
jgi:hypothetical protein